MVSAFSRQAVRLGPGTPDRDGVLVFHDGDLVAVLVRLTHETHDGLGGRWFLEAGFGHCADSDAPLFESPEEAEGWIVRQMRRAAPDRSDGVPRTEATINAPPDPASSGRAFRSRDGDSPD